MQVFEFKINPKKKNFSQECFYFLPKNFFEQKRGFLFCGGELYSFSPKRPTFLSEISLICKENFYKDFSKKNIIVFKKMLKSLNEFFEKLLKEGEDFWCFNLNFFVLSLKENEFLFSKTGKFKLLLFREKKLDELDPKFKKEVFTKMFSQIAKGKLEEGDTLLILNEELFKVLKKEKVFEKEELNEESLRKSIKEIEDLLEKSFGLLFGVHFKKSQKDSFKKESFEFKKLFQNISFQKSYFFHNLKERLFEPKNFLWILLILILILGRLLIK